MTVFLWFLLGGVLMSAIALVGSITLLLRESTLQRVLLPLVAFAAGSLIGGALFHMLPASCRQWLRIESTQESERSVCR